VRRPAANVSAGRPRSARPQREWREFGKAALAWAVSVAILVVLAGLAQRPSDATLLLNAASAAKWAPWWIYLIVILGGNYLRQALIPSDALPEWDVVVVVLAISAALFAAVTALYRILHRSKTSAQSSA
jgi:hypothetical protein